MGGLDGRQLDKTFLSDQSKAHARAVALLSDYAASGEDPYFRAYADAVLPSVLIHQREISILSGKKPHL
jgi:putative membrane protein